VRATATVPLAALLVAAGCAFSPIHRAVSVSDGRYVMGTILDITLIGVEARAAPSMLEELFTLGARLDAMMTLFDSSSQVSRLNRAAGEGPQPVDPEVTELLGRSVAYSRLTRGTFDVTVGPLVQLWIDSAVAGAPPSPAALARSRARVGADGVRVHADGRAELTREGVAVDLGGIAKGFALDRMRPVLRDRGVESALLNFGQSSTLAVGAPPGAEGWRLLVRGPEADILGLVTLKDQALSISSSFGHWVEIGDRRYGHVIDPRTGWPLTRSLQALIVAPDATFAEALSKALLILPPDEGVALVAAQSGCEGMLIDADRRRWKTPGWNRVTRWTPGLPAGFSRNGAVAPIAGAWRPRI
jgi:thiamine biosynthesis lipoprotein